MKEMIAYWSKLISAISSAIEQLSENLSQFNAGSINLLKHLLWESELRLSQATSLCGSIVHAGDQSVPVAIASDQSDSDSSIYSEDEKYY